MKNKSSQLRVKEDEFISFTADFLFKKLKDLSEKRKNISIALSGGTTPLPILSLLKDYKLNWDCFAFFMVDERNVSIEDSSSNYGNITKVFFNKINTVSYSMKNDDLPIEDCVSYYEKLLRKEIHIKKNNFPVIDLIILGVGDDGHTASLFPGTKGLNESVNCVIKNWIPQMNTERITLTYPILLNANEIILIAKGVGKEKILNQVALGFGENYPIHKIMNSNVKVTSIIGIN